MKKILLAGEGPNELGRWAREPAFRKDYGAGVIEALLRKIRPEGWVVCGGVSWRSIRKYKIGEHRNAEIRNVMGLVLKAREQGCDGVAFVRDRDGSRAKPNKQRAESIEDGIAQAQQKWRECPAIIGGVAIKRLESWLVALLREDGSEDMSNPEEYLEACDVIPKNTESYVALINSADLDGVPGDAESLARRLDRARKLL